MVVVGLVWDTVPEGVDCEARVCVCVKATGDIAFDPQLMLRMNDLQVSHWQAALSYLTSLQHTHTHTLPVRNIYMACHFSHTVADDSGFTCTISRDCPYSYCMLICLFLSLSLPFISVIILSFSPFICLSCPSHQAGYLSF